MNVLIVYAHPEPQSFCARMRSVATEVLTDAGHTVVISDLYAENFSATAGSDDFTNRLDPQCLNLGVEQEHAANNNGFAHDIQTGIERLFAADLLIMQFPLWWYSVPAIMKGWIDRVFAYGATYDFGRTWDRGVMQGKRVMLSFTTGAPESTFAPDGRNGDLERVLWPLHAGVFGVCGFQVLPPFVGWAPAWVGDEGRQAIIAQYTQRLRTIESDKPLFFHPHADYNEQSRLRPEIEPATPCQHRGTRKHLR
ncbi:MAG: NAD(P)H-dependent oxidoreductase [Gammaproteobacteria bacterium]|jgi:NAD(P)H dehydrogenase (quinone)|nr:NADPH quinone oxidoreductase [Chromatiales bacterium]MDP6673619.1 NAD(P)H-dependent oxidoreductase [Gammaproteobacteria bacterium]